MEKRNSPFIIDGQRLFHIYINKAKALWKVAVVWTTVSSNLYYFFFLFHRAKLPSDSLAWKRWK